VQACGKSLQRRGRSLLADLTNVVSNLVGDNGGERHLPDSLDVDVEGGTLASTPKLIYFLGQKAT